MPRRHRRSPPAQPFEITILQKLESRSPSLHRTFLLLDVDGDGYITRSDLKTALHNKLGIDLTPSQIDAIFARFAFYADHDDDDNNKPAAQPANNGGGGLRYPDFVRYANDTNSSSLSTSRGDYGRGLDLKIQDSYTVAPLTSPKRTVKYLRWAFKRKIQSHTVTQKGMKETNLFLAMDGNRSGKVTPKEFQEWVSKVGLELTAEQCQDLLGSHYVEEGINLKEFIKFIDELDDISGETLPWEEYETTTSSSLNPKYLFNGKTLESFEEALQCCVDDDKTDQAIISLMAEELYEKRMSFLNAFKKFDLDGTGMLNVDEFWKALRVVGVTVSRERAHDIFTKFDRQKRGLLSKGDFVILVTSARESLG